MYNRTPPRGPDSFPVGRPGLVPMDADRVDLRELLLKVWRRRRLILGATLISILLAGLLVLRITPLYTASSKIMLDPQQVRIVTSKAVVSDVDVSAQIVNSEVTVLGSNVLIEKVIADLGFAQLAVLDPASGGRSLTNIVRRLFGLDKSALKASAKTLHAQKVARLVVAIRKATNIRRIGKSFVIGVSVATPDPKLSMLLAGTITKEYIASQLATRRDSARQTAIWIEERIAVLRGELEKAEAVVDKYRATALVLDGASLNIASQQLLDLNKRLALERAAYTAARAEYDQIMKVVAKSGPEAALSMVTSPILDTLTLQRVDLVHQDAVLAERYGVDHPTRKRLGDEISQLDTDIVREIQKQIDAKRNAAETAQILVTAMTASIKELEQKVIKISANAIGLRNLERNVEAARKDYQEMLSRLSETRSQEQLQKPEARIIERATIPAAPSSPRPVLALSVGAMAGLALGLLLAFFLELSTATFRSAAELEQDTGLTLLAAIPYGAWKSPMAAYRELEHNPTGLFAERMRHLRTAVLRPGEGDEKRGRSILITSGAPSEGKTTTTLALAKMAAMAGKSVIVIDCDLRRSSLQQVFQWDMANDLGNFIQNECALGDAIHSDPRLDFDVLAASHPLPEAADELSEAWLEPMLDTLGKHYDLVLLDTPPVLAVSDALILSQVVDSTLYLVRWDSTARAAVLKGLSSFAEMGVVPSGVVLTMVKPHQEPMRYAEDYAYHA